MKKPSLLSRMYSIHQATTTKTSSSNSKQKKVKGQQEARYQVQLPVAVPKQVKEYWEKLAEQKRKEATPPDDIEVTSSE